MGRNPGHEARILGAQLALGQAVAQDRVRHALEGKTARQAAQRLGVPYGTLYSWLRRWPALIPAGWHDGRWRHGRRSVGQHDTAVIAKVE